MNLTLASHALQELIHAGVEEFVVCAGARNVPFLNVLLNETRLKKWWGFEERSSSFFALGRIRASGKPVAVITTSGTAVGELMPACMEALHTSLPLVLLTADRPKRFRYTGAPQSCYQKDFFGYYAPSSFDFDHQDSCDLSSWKANCPLHVNVCFEEPSRSKEETAPLSYPLFRTQSSSLPHADANNFLSHADKLLVVVSTLRKNSREAVVAWLKELGADCYIEAISGIREQINSVEPNLKLYTHVLRIGGIPTHRLWRDIEERREVKVFSLTEDPFSGISHSDYLQCNLEKWVPPLKKMKACGTAFSLAEGHMKELSERIPENSLIYLGNSLPIRDWDRCATQKYRGLMVEASRGLNGIDGQISTFLGLCRSDCSNWILIGDLTALYDLAAPWYLNQIEAKNITILVINNHGGKIFEKMFPFPEMLNEHQLDFEGMAQLWKIPYEKWTKVPQNLNYEGVRLVELTC